MTTTRARPVLFVGLVLGVVGCSPPDDQRTETADPTAGAQLRASWAPELVSRIDAGNQAIRADSFDLAREHFLAATELAPDVAAGWFGLYMAEQARGDAEAAEAALARAREIEAAANLIHDLPEGDGG